jgi:hypothetical protein
MWPSYVCVLPWCPAHPPRSAFPPRPQVFPVLVAVGQGLIFIALMFVLWMHVVAAWTPVANPALLAFVAGLVFALPGIR